MKLGTKLPHSSQISNVHPKNRSLITKLNWINLRFRSRNNYEIRALGFQSPMLPSASPPAMSPNWNSSDSDGAFPHVSRWKRSELGAEPEGYNSLCSLPSRPSGTKSSLKMSRFAEELNCRSTAPAIVPAAKNGPSGAKAAHADLGITFKHSITPNYKFLPVYMCLCQIEYLTLWNDLGLGFKTQNLWQIHREERRVDRGSNGNGRYLILSECVSTFSCVVSLIVFLGFDFPSFSFFSLFSLFIFSSGENF